MAVGSPFSLYLLLVHFILKFAAAQIEPQCECSDQLLGQTLQVSSPLYYCGADLKRQNQDPFNNNNSTCVNNKLYLCSRHLKIAVPIGPCPRFKKSLNGCNGSFKSRNDCLRNLKCSCGRRGRAPQSPQQVNCGQYLQGECISNVVYQCRLIGPPVPLQYCPHGCINGKCSPAIIEVTLEDKFGKEVDKPPSESQRSGRHPTDRNKKPSTTNGTSENHEVEFVTFASLIRIPLFNP